MNRIHSSPWTVRCPQTTPGDVHKITRRIPATGGQVARTLAQSTLLAYCTLSCIGSTPRQQTAHKLRGQLKKKRATQPMITHDRTPQQEGRAYFTTSHVWSDKSSLASALNVSHAGGKACQSFPRARGKRYGNSTPRNTGTVSRTCSPSPACVLFSVEAKSS